MTRKRPEPPPCLARAIKLRMPMMFDHETPRSRKIDLLENYLLETAYHQGELSEERMSLLIARVELQDEWDHLEGWEALRRTKTETAVTHAKMLVAPELYDAMQDNEWLLKRLSEEIDRLERDATKVSRAFTMIAGVS